MFGQGRPGVRCTRCVWTLVLAASPLAAAPSGLQPVNPALFDADLAEVWFADPLHGWAVGEHGVIWHTSDGGAEWRFQSSGVDCRLDSVFFLDKDNGWAAGGRTQPYTHVTIGELLRTRDGGRHWERQAKLPLPALKKVRFFNPQQGWAIAEPSPLYPSGVLTTDDAGRTWMGIPGPAAHGWLTGDFIDAQTGAVAGRQSGLAVVERRALVQPPTASLGLRGMRRMQLTSGAAGWLVGDGGLVLTSHDQGRSWQPPQAHLPPPTPEIFDWQALAARDQHCWIAGSPGSVVAHTADGGRTWILYQTKQSLPIRGLYFLDERRGWAVGALGTILATEDGGRTWQSRRAGRTRAALLAIYSQPGDVPLELFARLSGNEGYFGVAEILNRSDLTPGDTAADDLPERTREALAALGASSAEIAWRFPVAQPGMAIEAKRLVEGWDRMNDGAGVVRLEAHLVRQIRCWRPDVVVTHAAAPRGDDPLGHLINQLVLSAVERAADATSFPDQITLAGLRPWKASKVYGSLPPGQFGAVSLASGQLAPRSGMSLAEQAALPLALLTDRPAVRPASLGFQLYTNQLPQTQGQGEFFSGIPLPPGGEARRQLAGLYVDGIDYLQRIVQKQRNTQAILERADKLTASGGQLLGQLGDMLEGLDESSAGTLLYNLGQQYHRTGRWSLAAETFDLLVRRHPVHPLSPAACVWLVQYWSSGEAARREQHDQTAGAERPKRAIECGKLLEGRDMALASSAAVAFPLAVAYRNQGNSRQAERLYLGWQRSRSHDVWWACAEGERWLSNPVTPPPKPALRCARTDVKPRLDGKLDDSAWAGAAHCELHSVLADDADWPAAAMVAYDDEFLYLAVDCRKPAGVEYSSSSEPRPRDADLSAHDRVDFYIDLDRDWATSYRLTFDHRGWTGEACWGDATWDPQWFVAAAGTDASWSVEAAILLSELTAVAPSAQTAWAFGVQRTVPGVGFQSWTHPAAVEVKPEGFGYLLFQ